MEVLKQGQYAPIAVEEQIAIIYAATNGFVDDIPANEIRRYEKELVSWLRAEKPDLLKGIVEKKTLKKGLGDELKKACEEFAEVFEPKTQA